MNSERWCFHTLSSPKQGLTCIYCCKWRVLRLFNKMVLVSTANMIPPTKRARQNNVFGGENTREWRPRCTPKVSNTGSGARTIKMMVTISFGEWFVICEQCKKLYGEWFKSLSREISWRCLQIERSQIPGCGFRMAIQARITSCPVQPCAKLTLTR